MPGDVSATFDTGIQTLNALMQQHHFEQSVPQSGAGSGGAYAWAEFKRGSRRLELHFRQSLGLVTYHLGDAWLSHEDYMWVVTGERWSTAYPGFSNDPLDGFRHLRADLEQFGGEFLDGPDNAFLARVEQAAAIKAAMPKLPA
jgi:hypothetical protein